MGPKPKKRLLNVIPIAMTAPQSDPRNYLAINRSPAAVTADQMRTLYKLLYPFINSEFKHREDLREFTTKLVQALDAIIDDINNQFRSQANALQTHIHLHPMGPTSQTTTTIKPIMAKKILIQNATLVNTEHLTYTQKGDAKITIKVSGATTYYRRADSPTSGVVTKTQLATLLTAPGLTYVPFDVQERDSLVPTNPLNDSFANK